MKVVTVILALLTMVLSVSPCCASDNCATEVSTGQTDRHEDEANACSPFYSCSSCIGFTLAATTMEAASLISPKHSLFAEFRQGHVPQFYHTIWQPPRLS
ncbi:DUF6660 family protein [Pontibacter flavimaris]|uniref:DUF6660 family protein n=1 Tax=Pontibacter flavimaris TaxID=1797110 RepID=UPI00111539B3|nr:DUF6660 family protein [Pontibacter flavimaris]